VYFKRTRITVAPGIQVRMKISPSDPAVQHLNGTNLNNAMAIRRVKACRFSIENNPAHNLGDLKRASERKAAAKLKSANLRYTVGA
jgi:hypothetical protein